ETFNCRAIAPRPSRPIKWNVFLPISMPIVVMSQGRDLRDMECAPCAAYSLQDSTPHRAGTRPGHPITGPCSIVIEACRSEPLRQNVPVLGGCFLQQEQRRLAAIMAADVAGYSRLMAADESGTLARLKRLRTEVIEPKIAQFYGRIVGSAGDSLLVEFSSVFNAVQCAVEAQEGLADQNGNLPEDRRMTFRMGVNLGDVIPEGDSIHGDGVNIASRLEKLAEPGSVCIGRNVYEQVK